MKRCILLCLFFVLTEIKSQNVPELINYQGIARDASGQPMTNTTIAVSFTLWQGSPGGSNVFSETHNKTTNAFGLFELKIGSNNPTAFQTINWANGPYYMEIAIDGISIGTQQLVSVPYALYAKNAGNVNLQAGNGISITSGSIINTAPGITYTNGSNVTITSGSVINAIPSLSISGNTLSISGGNSVSLPVPQAGTNVSITGGSINATPSLVLTTNTLSITGGNSVVLPAAATTSFFSSGIGTISPTSGNSFTLTTPTPTFVNGQNISVLGTYPQYTISSTPSLVLNNGSLSISGGNTVVIPSATATAWGLNGNSGTNPNSNFIGTTDNVPLIFKAGGGQLMKLYHVITSTSGILGIGHAAVATFTPQSMLHVISTSPSFSNVLRLGNSNQPANEWQFDIDATSNMFIKNENSNSPITVMTFSNDGKIGVNNASPTHLFHINVPNSSNGINAVHAVHHGTGSAGFFEATNVSNGSAVLNVNSSNNGPGILLNSSGNTFGIRAIKSGTAGNVVYIESNNSSNTSAALNINYSHNGSAINIFPLASTNIQPIVNISHSTAGNGIKITSTTTSTNAAVLIDKNTNSGLGLSINMGSLTTSDGINVNHSGNGGNGLYISKSGLGQAVFAISSGSSTSLYSEKIAGIGEAAAFVNSSATNTSPVVFVQNKNGSGPSLIASVLSGSGNVIVAQAQGASSKNSLVLDNGHLNSISSTPPSFGALSYIGGFNSLTTAVMPSTNTDVKGVITFSTAVTGFTDPNFANVRVNFSKPYSNTPVVIITPSGTTDMKGLSYKVTSDTGGFNIVIYRPFNMTSPTTLSLSGFTFNYFVIE